jgi:hypothetical protein
MYILRITLYWSFTLLGAGQPMDVRFTDREAAWLG